MEKAASEQEDCRKIHSEITQLVALRFQLTTLSVVIFVAMLGWYTTLVSKNTEMAPHIVGPMMIIIQIFLTSIFMYYIHLRRIIRIFSIYLSVKFGSSWESDWRKFRNGVNSTRFKTYTAFGANLFVVLGILSVVYPMGLFWFGLGVEAYRFAMNPLCWVATVILAFYMVFVVLIGHGVIATFNEEHLEQTWTSLLSEPVAKTVD